MLCAAASFFTPERYTVVKSASEAAKAVRELEGQPKWGAELASLERDLEAFIASARAG